MRKYLNNLKNRIQSFFRDRNSLVGDLTDYFKNKRNRISLLIVVVLILALPVGIYLLRQQQIFKSRANALPIEYTGANVDHRSDGTWVTKTTSSQVSIKITSPFGPPGTPAPAAAQEAPAQAPAPPANLSASCSDSGTTGSFNWGGVSGATSYNVFISTSGHSYDWSTCASPNICLGNISGTSYNYPSLIAGTSYQWYVASCNSAGCSNAAAGSNFTCAAPAAAASATDNARPRGYLVYTGGCSTVTGFACDGDFVNGPIQIDFWDQASNHFSTTTTFHWDAASDQYCGDSSGTQHNYGFSATIPDSFKDGTVHNVTAYGINVDSNGTRVDSNATNPNLHSVLLVAGDSTNQISCPPIK